MNQLTPNNLYLGDCLDLMTQIPDKSVEGVVVHTKADRDFVKFKDN